MMKALTEGILRRYTFSAQETIILLFTNGLVIGTLLYRKGIIISILFSNITLSLVMIFLTYIAGISAFVDLTSSLSTPLTFLIFSRFHLFTRASGIFALGNS